MQKGRRIDDNAPAVGKGRDAAGRLACAESLPAGQTTAARATRTGTDLYDGVPLSLSM